MFPAIENGCPATGKNEIEPLCVLVVADVGAMVRLEPNAIDGAGPFLGLGQQ